MFYFKCVNPRQKVWLSKFSAWLQFQNVDNEIGIFQTRKEEVAEVIRGLGVSTVTEIAAAEFAELEGKKKADLTAPAPWREEFNPGQKRVARDTGSSVPQAKPSPIQSSSSLASAAADTKPAPPPVAPRIAPVPPPQMPDMKPKIKIKKPTPPTDK